MREQNINIRRNKRDPYDTNKLVADELERLGRPRPTDRHARAIAQLIDARIASEITSDPESMGYSGKTKAEIAALLNQPYDKTFVHPWGNETVKMAPRWSNVIAGVPFAPNSCDENDIP